MEETQTMTLDELKQQISSAVANSMKSQSDAFEARLSDIIDKLPKKDSTQTSEKAELAEGGFLESVSEFKVWDIPVGQAAAGGFVAILASELVDGFMAKQSPMVRGIVKLGAAGAAVKWGGKVLGSTGSKAVALLLAFDAIRDITPLDTWANNIANKVSGVIPTGGLGGQTGGGKPVSAVQQASKVAADYYRGTGV